MSASPELKKEMLARVAAFLAQHEKDLANAGMRGDQAMLAEIELYSAIPEKLRRLLDRSGPHEIYERLHKGCPAAVDRIYRSARTIPGYMDKVETFWDAMKGHEEMAVGEDEEESLPGENENENRVPLRAGGSRQKGTPKAGGQLEDFEVPKHAGYCEETDMPATTFDVPVETPIDEAEAAEIQEADFGEEDGIEEAEPDEEV